MKRKSFFILFITIQIFFIFFQIHKQSHIIKLSYQKQKHEKLKNELTERKQNLKQQLYALHNPRAIKSFALAQNMEKIKLSQIKSEHEYDQPPAA